MAVSSREVIVLYRKLLRYSRQLRFTDSEFFTQRVQKEFRKNQTLTDGEQIKYNYEFPELKENDLEEKFISGWGPGGQKVNKAQNAVFLRHIPSGLYVKVHEKRELHKNREIARDLLQLKLDDHINGDNSVTAQEKRYKDRQQSRKDYKAAKLRELKARFKEQIRVEQSQKTCDSDV